MGYNKEVSKGTMDNLFSQENEEHLTRVVVDVSSRKFLLYSNEGDRREVSCDTVDEFMNVLTCVKDFDEIGLLGDDVLVYAEPKIK